MKVRNNWIKITTEQGLKQLKKIAQGTWYETNPEYIHFNLANVVLMEKDDWENNSTVTIAKGECHIIMKLTDEAFKKIEELIFK